MRRFLVKFSVLAVLAGCGVGIEDSAGPDVDREIKNDKLRGEYESLRGTYEGFIRLGQAKRRFPVRLYLWTGEVQEAPLPGDLKPGIRVVLRGRLMQSQFIGDSDNLIMTGQFDGLTGRLRLDPDLKLSETPSGCRLGGQDPITITGTFSAGKLAGTVLRNGQEWATLEDMTLLTRDVSTGSILSEEQEYKRLQETYEPVTGMYEGDLLRNVCGTTRKEKFSLWLYIERIQEGSSNGTPCHVPRLMVRTLRQYAGELADVQYRSINRFDPDSFLPQFTSAGSTIDLNMVNGILKGEISTSGYWGSVSLKRMSKEVVAPDDETLLHRERLERTYSMFTGIYTGTNKAYQGADWPVRLHMFIDEKNINGVSTPVLIGLYRRPDFTDETIGERRMEVSVSIDGCEPVLTMKSDATGVGGRVPNAGLMRYSAVYRNGTMEGELIDHRGPQGYLKVKRQK